MRTTQAAGNGAHVIGAGAAAAADHAQAEPAVEADHVVGEHVGGLGEQLARPRVNG
jgi:hypothetical protein